MPTPLTVFLLFKTSRIINKYLYTPVSVGCFVTETQNRHRHPQWKLLERVNNYFVSVHFHHAIPALQIIPELNVWWHFIPINPPHVENVQRLTFIHRQATQDPVPYQLVTFKIAWLTGNCGSHHCPASQENISPFIASSGKDKNSDHGLQ